MKVRDRDNGLKTLIKNLDETLVLDIALGLPPTAPEKVAERGLFNEFGLGVPERSFIRGWFDKNRNEFPALIKRAFRPVIKGKSTQGEAVVWLGKALLRSMRANIRAGILPENAPSTLKKKRGETPLIDTGALYRNLKYWLVPRAK